MLQIQNLKSSVLAAMLPRDRPLIQPAIGWGVFGMMLIYGQFAPSHQRPLFWGLGLLIAGAVYALNELFRLRQQSLRLQADFAAQCSQLNQAIASAHENAVERDMTEEALNESQTRYFHLAEATFEAICIHDNGTIVDANSNFGKLFGYGPDELVGHSIFEVIAPEKRAEAEICIREKNTETRECVGLRRDGSRFPVEASIKLMPYNGREVRVVALRDLTEQRRQEAEREMQSLQVHFSETGRKAILESSLDGILIFGEDDVILDVNSAAEKVFGRTRSELIGQKVAETVIALPHRQNYLALHAERKLGGKGFIGRRLKVMSLRKDGSEFESEVTTTAIDNLKGVDFVASVRDITEHRKIEVEMKAAHDAALDSARFKSQFLANMSHEIRTPMNAIVGMSDLLLDTPLNDEQKDFANTVKQASDSLLSLINQILDFSKIEAGKMTLENEDFDLRELAEGVAGMFAARAQAKGLELVLDLGPGLPTQLRGDSGRLGQVLVNLMGNAVKFSEKGEILFSIRCSSAKKENAALHFEIRDSGIGIGDEALKRLFQPFVQADGSITRRFGGTGLGLAISKELVELMGGKIGVSSSQDGPSGTSFWFDLSFERQGEFKEAREAGLVEAVSGLKVLVVDDNATNCLIVSHQLATWKIRHAAADAPAAALEMLAAAAREGAPYDLVLLDLQMPQKDGLSLAAELSVSVEFPRPRMVLMSSLGQSPAPELLKNSGIQACLHKPVKQSALLRALQGSGQPDSILAGRPENAPSKPPVQGPAREACVLVAEDNGVNQRVIRTQLGKLGVKADIVSNGREALDAIAKKEYALVLMDCQMPVMDGLLAVAQIRADEMEAGGNRHLPVVAMTANALEGDEMTCLRAGMDDYLAKPVKLESLGKVLDRWIPSARPASLLEAGAHDAVPVFSEAELKHGIGEGYKEDGTFGVLVDLFSTDTPQRLARIEKALAERDACTLCLEAHAIKGSCGSLGALRMGKTAGALEALGKDKRTEDAGAALSRLKEEFTITLAELAKAAGPAVSAA